MSTRKAAVIATLVVAGIIAFFALAIFVAKLLGDVILVIPIVGFSLILAMIWLTIYTNIKGS